MLLLLEATANNNVRKIRGRGRRRGGAREKKSEMKIHPSLDPEASELSSTCVYRYTFPDNVRILRYLRCS